MFSVFLAASRPALDPARLTGPVLEEPTWHDIVDMARDLPKDNTDEHIYKLVQVRKIGLRS